MPRAETRVVTPETTHKALGRNPTQHLATEIELDVASDHNIYAGFSANLSDAGLFVATYQPQAVGDRLRVRFRLPGIEKPIEAKVEVQWIRTTDAGEDGPPGFGGAFVELDPDGRAAVARFVENRDPIFYAE
jgi:uncharacterized protein (TIGR02266 family)